MKFIEALKLKNKLFLLFLLITFGLISIGIMGAVNMKSMKKNIDYIYFGSLVPVTELNNILQTYNGELTTTIYKIKSAQISQSEAIARIDSALNKIKKNWQSYKSHYKKEHEIEYVEYVALEIKSINNYFISIVKEGIAGKDLKSISLNTLEHNAEKIHQILSKLINYEVEVARYERSYFLQKYDTLVSQVFTILVLVVIGILFISYYVFKSIQNDHTTLEIATKKLKQANKKLENVSYTDSLTSLHNRRYFNFIYDKELQRARRNHTYITYMMLDIDYFKQYNDTYGHLEGDSALKSVAKVLKESLKRPGDFVFRLGDEEFGILLTQTNEENSEKIAQGICDAVRAKEIKHERSKANAFLTVSIGLVCCIADEALDDEILLSKADKLLYEAKESGRDRYRSETNGANESTETEVAEEKIEKKL